MKTFLLSIALCATGCAQNVVMTGGVTNTGAITIPVAGAPPTAGWIGPITVPSYVTTNHSGLPYLPGDGYVYFESFTGSFVSGTGTNHIERAAIDGSGNITLPYVDITGTGLPNNSSQQAGRIVVLTGGTVMVFTANASGSGGGQQPYYWNGSTAWATIGGFSGGGYGGNVSVSAYGTDPATGDNYFAVPAQGVIYKNSSGARTTFSIVTTAAGGAYAYTGNGTGSPTTCVTGATGQGGGGGAGTGCSGAVYDMWVGNLGDGNGTEMWVVGEGSPSAISTGLGTGNYQNYGVFSGSSGYLSNGLSIDSSPLKTCFVRPFNSGATQLSCIDNTTKAITQYSSPNPRVGNTFPFSPNNNQVGILHWQNGTNWMVTGQNTAVFMYISSDDGATWIDTMTLSPPTQCNQTNLRIGAAHNDHLILTRNSSDQYCIYGPR